MINFAISCLQDEVMDKFRTHYMKVISIVLVLLSIED